jgi:hypothetical protein
LNHGRIHTLANPPRFVCASRQAARLPTRWLIGCWQGTATPCGC